MFKQNTKLPEGQSVGATLSQPDSQDSSRVDEPKRKIVILGKEYPLYMSFIMIDGQDAQAEAHHNLGNIYGPQGRISEAIHEFQEALRIAPNDPETHGSLGMAYGVQGRVQDEIREYLMAIKLNPNLPVPHHNLGITYVEQGRRSEGIAELRIAKRLGYPPAAQVLASYGIPY